MQKAIIFEHNEISELIKKEAVKLSNALSSDILRVTFAPQTNNQVVAIVAYGDGTSHLKLIK